MEQKRTRVLPGLVGVLLAQQPQAPELARSYTGVVHSRHGEEAIRAQGILGKPIFGVVMEIPGRVGRRLFGSRERSIGTLLVAAILLASSLWFFNARDDRGRTARLTADAWYYHAYLPSLVFDQDLDFRDEYKITKNWYRFGDTPTGRQANVFGIGPAIYELPFFMAGHGLAKATGGQADGFSRPEVELSLYASLIFSLGGILFAARFLRRRLGSRYGPLAVALLVACAGPVVYYAVRQPGYAHPFATFWVAWLVDHWDASFQNDPAPRSWRFWITMGLLIGAASLARPQLVLWSLLGVYAASSDLVRARALGFGRRDMLRLIGPWLVGAICALCLVLPQLMSWNALYGSFFPSPQGNGFMRWGESAWLETILSSRNGLFPWAPIYALGFVGLLIGLRRHTRVCSALLLGWLLQAYVNGAAWDWWAGGSFGGRRFDSCFVAFVFGLGILLLGPWARESRDRVNQAKRIATIGVGILCLFLVGSNLHFASTQSAPTVRIYGGESASRILRRASGSFAHPAAWLSSLSNLPARALFAWRNEVSLSAYDRVVGVHQLGELFPGLNSFRGKNRQSLGLNPKSPLLVGLEQAEGGRLVAPSGKAHFLVGLNRRGPVQLHIRTKGSAGEKPTMTLNGRHLDVLEQSQGNYLTTLSTYRRGNNRIDIASSPGFVLELVELSATVNAAGQQVSP